MSAITESAVRSALSRVEDPEIGKPLTELGMVKSIAVNGPDVDVELYLTIAGCPMKSTITSNAQAAVEEKASGDGVKYRVLWESVVNTEEIESVSLNDSVIFL